MRVVVQKAVIKVVTPEIVYFKCDFCGKRCGVKGNPKEIWYPIGQLGSSKPKHYCKKTNCHAKSEEKNHATTR